MKTETVTRHVPDSAAILAALKESPCTAGELVETTGMSFAVVGVLLEALWKLGLVEFERGLAELGEADVVYWVLRGDA